MDQNRGSDVGFAVPMLPVNYASATQKMSTLASTSSAGASSSTGSSNQQQQQAAAVIRRRRFSTAKIQPTRIKKVMQSDEDIGRMVQSVPVSIGRAMEHFAEKFLQAAAEATQFTSSKTLNPQHMKQAVLNTPHFSFLESVFKDVALPQQASELNTARTGMTLRGQQMLQEQQNSDFASAILANAQMQMMQMDQQALKQEDGTISPYLVDPQSPAAPLPLYLQGIPSNYPVVQELTATVPLSPSTPTTQLVNGMLGMLKYSKKDSEGQRLTGLKRASTDGDGEDRPKRGRPKKLKPEKCIDDDLYEEASRNIAKEDKDRELMPPPALPIGRP
ncbi:Transcription factor CBF/NF-Y/archaeal histone domain-containing protein [Caenorhabditis elegans]|uniref:Transcription factor CBF/NF-Y/archaeal histone domain-containing protein n=2 Tax=Caenorhabditis elegans TaxID=6239 RepID=Q20237_CAEEL|nr:Transcription factor CBF/NF-Y/archaeal histone domain-containing protein [Caenorhabditis elegans]CAA94762.1 Transcription factor CBF/NF-Y/archaeal histone domain-containing protein [Caenorhabditis elegans]|eukprot:NP_001023906.1 DRAP1 corepressor homolog [Caenorhabditis elegans]